MRVPPRLRLVDRSAWGPYLTPVVEYVERTACLLMNKPVQVNICRNLSLSAHVVYGPDAGLAFNYSRLGTRWFVGPVADINEVMIHGLAHEFSADATSEEYQEAVATLAAELRARALASPELFDLRRPASSSLVRTALPPIPEDPAAPAWRHRAYAANAMKAASRLPFIGPPIPTMAELRGNVAVAPAVPAGLASSGEIIWDPFAYLDAIFGS